MRILSSLKSYFVAWSAKNMSEMSSLPATIVMPDITVLCKICYKVRREVCVYE